MSLCICLRNSSLSHYLGLERLSSHPVEQFFGRYRNHFCGQYQTITAFSYAVKTAISLEFEYNCGVNFSIAKRVNFAGAHLEFVNSFGQRSDINNFQIDCFDECITDIVVNLFECAVGNESTLHKKTIEFIEELNSYFCKYSSSVYQHFSITKGCALYSRIVAVNKNDHEFQNPSLPNSYQINEQIL